MKDEPNSSLVRGIDTLVGLAEAGRPVAFSVLGASLRMPPSTVHRILQSLRKAGYVTQDPATGSYSPGPAFLQAAAIFSSASTLPRSIESALQTLVSGSGESAYFGLYLLAMGPGRPRSADRLAALIRAAGFDEVTPRPTRTPLQVGLLTARRQAPV